MNFLKKIFGYPKLRDLEKLILDKASSSMPFSDSFILNKQIENISKIQRISHDQEVDFYYSKNGSIPCFKTENEVESLATLKLGSRKRPHEIDVEVFAVNGRLFSIEFSLPPEYFGNDEIDIKLSANEDFFRHQNLSRSIELKISDLAYLKFPKLTKIESFLMAAVLKLLPESKRGILVGQICTISSVERSLYGQCVDIFYNENLSAERTFDNAGDKIYLAKADLKNKNSGHEAAAGVLISNGHLFSIIFNSPPDDLQDGDIHIAVKLNDSVFSQRKI